MELCFGKVGDDIVMVGVKDHEAFHVNKNTFCTGLKPKGWISTTFIGCVADMLCVRECIKVDVQRWFFLLTRENIEYVSQKDPDESNQSIVSLNNK